MFFSSSFLLLQPSSFWLPLLLLPLLPFLLSELYAQPNITSPLLPIRLGAAAPPCVFAAFLTVAF